MDLQLGADAAESLAGVKTLCVRVGSEILEITGGTYKKSADTTDAQFGKQIEALASELEFEVVGVEDLHAKSPTVLFLSYHTTLNEQGDIWVFAEASILQRVHLARHLDTHCWGRTWSTYNTGMLGSYDEIYPTLKTLAEKTMGAIKAAE